MPPKKYSRLYLYDSLDRVTGVNATQIFYNLTRLATEIEGERKTRLFEYDAQPMALQDVGNAQATRLLATDMQSSVMHSAQQAQTYTPYGHQRGANSLLSIVGFNGEKPDSMTGHYLLGRGYRAFNPVLMRFNSPDNLSPFGKGGFNAYAYCGNDPINRSDPTGHFWKLLKRAWKYIKPRAALPRRSSTSATSIDSNWTFVARPNDPYVHLSTSTVPPHHPEE